MGLAGRINRRRNLGLKEEKRKKKEKNKEKERDTPKARSQGVTSQTQRWQDAQGVTFC